MNDPVIERIAREDPALGFRSGTADHLLARLRHEIGEAERPPAQVRVRRRLGQLAAPTAAASIAVAVAVAAVVLPGHGSRGSNPQARPTRSVSAVALGSVRVMSGSEVLLARQGALWIAGAHALQRLNPATGAITATIRLPVPGIAAGVAFGAGSAWVASGGANTGSAPTLVRIDPADGQIQATIDVTQSSPEHVRVLGGGIAFTAGQVWLSRGATASHGDVVSVDPATNRIDAAPVPVGTGPEALLAAFGSLWVDNTGQTIGLTHAPALPASVAQLDPRTRQVTTEPFAGAPSAGFGSLWIRHDDTITRYDPSTQLPIARIHVPHVIAVAFGASRAWAISGPTGTPGQTGSTAKLVQIDPRTNRIVGTPIRLQVPEPVGIAVSGHDLWIADYQLGLLHFRLTSR